MFNKVILCIYPKTLLLCIGYNSNTIQMKTSRLFTFTLVKVDTTKFSYLWFLTDGGGKDVPKKKTKIIYKNSKLKKEDRRTEEITEQAKKIDKDHHPKKPKRKTLFLKRRG